MGAGLVTDLALARRLDRAEGMANARFVEARARARPDIGAAWIEVAGAYAMFDGDGSPCTQSFCLGLFQQPSADDMTRIEAFFHRRGAAAHHDASPLAGVRLFQMLQERGYRPIELSQAMYLPLTIRLVAPDTAVRVRIAGREDHETWVQTAAEGWRELTEPKDDVPDLMRLIVSREKSPCFLAELDGRPVGAAAYFEHERVALLAGASTIPEWRNLGAQRAMLHARLEYAAKSGCDLAMVVTEPGSASQRNAERQGFRIAYTRTKWELKQTG
jgi:GNAT superfamily N-acetyltransferase